MDPPDQEEARRRLLETAYENPAPLNAETLTLGCEFEFLLMYSRPPDQGTFGPNRGIEVIQEALDKPELTKCADQDCKEEFQFHLQVSSSTHWFAQEYSKWQVTVDASVLPLAEEKACLGGREDLQFYPIEVKSRVLRYCEEAHQKQQGGKHVHWITFQTEISLVLARLYKSFGVGRKENVNSKYHILPTSRSGLHVHVGNGVGVAIPFNTAKKVFSTFVACERQLDRLAGTIDITGTSLGTVESQMPHIANSEIDRHCIRACYNKPLSVYLIAGAHMRRQTANIPGSIIAGDEDYLESMYPLSVSKTIRDFDDIKYGHDVGSWLKFVDSTCDYADLRGLYCMHDKNCTINMENLPNRRELPTRSIKDDPLDQKLTIEFRQHAGTLNSASALSFVELSIKLILRCHAIQDNEFKELTSPRGKLRNPEVGALELLEFLECNGETIDFYHNLLTKKDSPLMKNLDVEEAMVKQHKDNFPWAEFALAEIQKSRTSINPQFVDQVIMMKLLTGGYGQYSRADLEVLLPSKTSTKQRERLMIGYQVPLPKNPDTGKWVSGLPGVDMELSKTFTMHNWST